MTVTDFHVQKQSLERLQEELDGKVPISLNQKHREGYGGFAKLSGNKGR